MASDLYWLPPPETQEKNFLDLKYEIGRYFDEEYNGANIDCVATKEMIPFLKGIVSVGNKSQSESAQQLINAIEKYGKVQLIIGW